MGGHTTKEIHYMVIHQPPLGVASTPKSGTAAHTSYRKATHRNTRAQASADTRFRGHLELSIRRASSQRNHHTNANYWVPTRLDVETGNSAVELIPVSCIPELGKLSHFYVIVKGRRYSNQIVENTNLYVSLT